MYDKGSRAIGGGGEVGEEEVKKGEEVKWERR